MSNATEEIKPLRPVLVPQPAIDPVVARNIERWRREQEEKKAKRDKKQQAIKAALKARFNREPSREELRAASKGLAEERRSKWLLRSGRATIGEIVATHKEGK